MRTVPERPIHRRVVQLDPVVLNPPDPRFTPEVHPWQMLKLGIYEGAGLDWIQGDPSEFDPEWLKEARFSLNGGGDPSLNLLGVGNGIYRDVYRMRGDSPDVHGWLQWYFRYVEGRRREDLDDFQIARWASVRHRSQTNVLRAGMRDPRAVPAHRQRLLEWACDPFFDCREEKTE